jgi:hypothetical protein
VRAFRRVRLLGPSNARWRLTSCRADGNQPDIYVDESTAFFLLPYTFKNIALWRGWKADLKAAERVQRGMKSERNWRPGSGQAAVHWLRMSARYDVVGVGSFLSTEDQPANALT